MKKYEIMKGYTSKYQMIVYPKGRVRLENQIELTELAVGGSEDDKNRSIQYTKQGELVLTYYAPDYRDNNTKQLFFTQVVVYETTKEILKNYENLIFCQFSSGEDFVEVVKEPNHFPLYESLILTKEQLEAKSIITKEQEKQIYKEENENTWKELVYEILYQSLIGMEQPIVIFVPESEPDYQRYCQIILYRLVQYIPYGCRKNLTFETNGEEENILIQFVKETNKNREKYPDAYRMWEQRTRSEKRHEDMERLVNYIFEYGIHNFQEIEEVPIEEWNVDLYCQFVKIGFWSKLKKIDKITFEEWKNFKNNNKVETTLTKRFDQMVHDLVIKGVIHSGTIDMALEATSSMIHNCSDIVEYYKDYASLLQLLKGFYTTVSNEWMQKIGSQIRDDKTTNINEKLEEFEETKQNIISIFGKRKTFILQYILTNRMRTEDSIIEKEMIERIKRAFSEQREDSSTLKQLIDWSETMNLGKRETKRFADLFFEQYRQLLYEKECELYEKWDDLAEFVLSSNCLQCASNYHEISVEIKEWQQYRKQLKRKIDSIDTVTEFLQEERQGHLTIEKKEELMDQLLKDGLDLGEYFLAYKEVGGYAEEEIRTLFREEIKRQKRNYKTKEMKHIRLGDYFGIEQVILEKRIGFSVYHGKSLEQLLYDVIFMEIVMPQIHEVSLYHKKNPEKKVSVNCRDLKEVLLYLLGYINKEPQGEKTQQIVMDMLIDSGMIRGKKQEEQIQQVEIEETKEQEKESIEDLQKEVEVIKEKKKKKSGLILGGILVLAGVFLCGMFLGKKLEQKKQEMNISSVEYVDEYKDIL